MSPPGRLIAFSLFLTTVVGFGEVASTSVTKCSLSLNSDELLTISATVGNVGKSMVLDTGSFETVLFQAEGVNSLENHIHPSDSNDRIPLLYQSLRVYHSLRKHRHVFASACAPDRLYLGSDVFVADKFAPRRASLGNIQGVIGLSPMIVLQRLATGWKSVSLTFPSSKDEDGSLQIRNDEDESLETNLFPLNTNHYWSAELQQLDINGESLLRGQTSVIFDSGSNYFGFSPNLYKRVQSILSTHACRNQQSLVTLTPLGKDEKTPLSFNIPPIIEDRGNRDNAACMYPIFRADHSRFADHLNKHDIVIIGTMGLRGKTLTLHRKSNSNSSGNDPVFYLSVN